MSFSYFVYLIGIAYFYQIKLSVKFNKTEKSIETILVYKKKVRKTNE